MSKTTITLFALLLVAAIGAISFLTLRNFSLAYSSPFDNPSLAFVQSYVKPGVFNIMKVNSKCVNGYPNITLGWSAASKADSYTVQRKLVAASTWSKLGTTKGLSFVDDTSKSGYSPVAYQYRIQATNRYGNRNSASFQYTVMSCPASTPASTPESSLTSTSTLTSSSPTSTPTTTAKVKWGIYLPGSLSTFESSIGRQVDMQAVFVGWGNDGDFPSEYSSALAQKGKTLVIFWEPTVNYDSITSGQWDSYMRVSFAASAKSYGGPIILAPFHEMNGNWDVWDGTASGNTPQKFINGWQYVHKFFDGVTNVKFGWAVNNDSVPDTAANAIGAYYPGDAYVDYVGVDGFNFNDPWQTFSQVFDNALAKVSVYHKPVYLFSMACAQGSGKAAWITDAFTVQVPKHPEIAGWIWFNENKEQNWLVSSDSASLSAFKAVLP